MKPGTLSTVELSILALAGCGFVVALWADYPLAQNLLWLAGLIGILFYSAIRLIIRGTETERQFFLIFPLTSITIWQFAYLHGVNVSPFLYITTAFIFFALSVKFALLSAVVLAILSAIPVLHGHCQPQIVMWLVFSSGIWFLFFWLQSHERESIQTRFEHMERRAKGFISPVQQITGTGVMPDLDSDTQLAKAAASAFRLESLMGWLTDVIHEVMHPHSCFFFFLDQQEANLKVLAHKSKSRFFDENTIIEVGSQGILSWVVQHKQKIRHERLPRELQHPEYYNAREKILSCMIYPVIINDRVEGLLGIDGRRSYSFGVDEEQLMELFAKLTADLVEAFRIYQQKESHADYMEAFYRAIKQIIQTRLDLKTRLELLLKISDMIKKSDELAVAIPKGDGTVVMRKALGDHSQRLVGAVVHPESTCGRLLQSDIEVTALSAEEFYAENRNLIMAGETRLRVNSLLYVALPLQRTKGMLLLGSRKRDYFTHNDRFVFSTLAAQFGVAIENAINLARIKELAITDGLTGLYNHRYFQDFLSKEVKLAKRDKSAFSLIIMDIDHFKGFNDTYGHQAGDEVLKHLARLLTEQAREMDIVARYGGEEFVIILRQCDLKMAVKTAERIRKACDKSRLHWENLDLHITISIGVSCYPTHADNPAAMIAVADEAMYEAKRGGRNRVKVAETKES